MRELIGAQEGSPEVKRGGGFETLSIFAKGLQEVYENNSIARGSKERTSFAGQTLVLICSRLETMAAKLHLYAAVAADVAQLKLDELAFVAIEQLTCAW